VQCLYYPFPGRAGIMYYTYVVCAKRKLGIQKKMYAPCDFHWSPSTSPFSMHIEQNDGGGDVLGERCVLEVNDLLCSPINRRFCISFPHSKIVGCQELTQPTIIVGGPRVWLTE
jgi:hypothetical protein